VKHLPRRTIRVSALIVILMGWSSASLSAHADDEGGGDAATIYTASDFTWLAQGVDPGFTGPATLRVWAPPRDIWRLTEADGVITLILASKEGDPEPQWRTLGNVTLSQRKPLKIVVARDSADVGDNGQATPQDHPQSKTAKAEAAQSKQPLPVPALLLVSARSDIDTRATLDIVRGRTDSIEPTSDQRRTRVRTNWQGADFQAPPTVAAWQDRKRHLREQMLVALGLWPMFPKTPLAPKISGKHNRDQYTIEKVVLETFPGFTLSGNLYRPINQRGRAPAIMCPHGHWDDGRVNPEVQQRCIRWAKLGCVVFLYDMVGYNDSKPFTHAFLNDRLRRWGLSLTTLQTWNSIRALDWLTSLPDVDPARIGCTGESGGATQTFLLTALDDRIKVSAPVVMVSDTFQGGCVCENAAGLRHETDNVEFAAMCAPRPLIMVGAAGDWTAKTMSRAFPAIRGVYSLLGATDRVTAQVFDFPHNYNQTTRNAVYAFMGHWLLGIDDSTQTREGNQQPEKPEDLFTFNAKEPAPRDRKSPAELEAYLIGIQRRLLDELAPAATNPTRWEASRHLLATSLEHRVGAINPASEDLTGHEVRRISRERLTIVHSVVGRPSADDAIPVVRLLPAKPTGRLTIIAHSRGKAALTTASGEPAPLAKALLSLGQSVVGFDPLFVGESVDPRSPASRRPSVVHVETYNRVVAADQMQDLATVVAWARLQPDVREVSLVGQGLAGPQVLLARPLLEGLARTAVELEELPDPQASGPYPAQLDLPGMFQFGGFGTAAALTAPAPLWVCGPSANFDGSWTKAAYAQAGADHLLRLEPHRPNALETAQWLDSGD
jgi:dienelactone hydrolase